MEVKQFMVTSLPDWIGCLLGVVLLSNASGVPTSSAEVMVATVSPKKEGFLRELAEQPSLKLRYRFYEPVH